VVYYLHTDSLGSINLVTAEDGAVAGRQLYTPFGESRRREGTLPTGRGFTGAPLDETGLLFLQARYLDPALGRFVSADTVAPEARNPLAATDGR